MRLFRVILCLTLPVLLPVPGLLAQQYTLSESQRVLAGPSHRIIRCAGGDFITITYPFPNDEGPIIISRFDHKLSQLYSNPLPALLKEHYRASFEIDGRLSIVCNTDKGDITRYEIDEKTGALAGTPAPFTNMEAKKDRVFKFYSGSATNKHFYFLFVAQEPKKGNGISIQGIIFDRQLNQVASLSFTTPETRNDVKYIHAVQADDGTLSIIYTTPVKPTKENYTSYQYTISQVDTKGKTVTTPLSGVPPGDLKDLDWTVHGSQLYFTGFLAPGKKDACKIVVSGSFDPGQQKLTDLRQTDLSTLVTQPQAPDLLKKTGTDGLPMDAILRRTIPLSDGSRALFLETFGSGGYVNHYTVSPTSPVSYGITNFNRGWVYILKVDKNNTPQQLTLITKVQTEPDISIAIGIMCMADEKENLHVFFYDHRKNTEAVTASPLLMTGTDYKINELFCVSIAPDGSTKKQIIPQPNPDTRIILEESPMDSKNEIDFMALKIKSRASVNALFNRGEFHLGTIAVN